MCKDHAIKNELVDRTCRARLVAPWARIPRGISGTRCESQWMVAIVDVTVVPAAAAAAGRELDRLDAAVLVRPLLTRRWSLDPRPANRQQYRSGLPLKDSNRDVVVVSLHVALLL